MQQLNDALNLVNKYLSDPENFIGLIASNNLEDLSVARGLLEDVVKRIGDEAFYEIIEQIDRVEDDFDDDEHVSYCKSSLNSWDEESIEHYSAWFLALNIDEKGNPNLNLN